MYIYIYYIISLECVFQVAFFRAVFSKITWGAFPKLENDKYIQKNKNKIASRKNAHNKPKQKEVSRLSAPKTTNTQ